MSTEAFVWSVIAGVVAIVLHQALSPIARGLVKLWVRVLPGRLRARYREEWLCLLHDLPSDLRRLGESVSIARGAIQMRWQETPENLVQRSLSISRNLGRLTVKLLIATVNLPSGLQSNPSEIEGFEGIYLVKEIHI